MIKTIGALIKITAISLVVLFYINFLPHRDSAIILSLALVFFSLFQPTLLKLSVALTFALTTIGLELYFANNGIMVPVAGISEVASFYLINIVAYFLVFTAVGAITLISGIRPVIADRIMLLSVICVLIKMVDGLVSVASAGTLVPHYVDVAFYTSFNVVYTVMIYFLIKRYPGDRIHIFDERRASDSGYHWDMENSSGVHKNTLRRSGDKECR